MRRTTKLFITVDAVVAAVAALVIWQASGTMAAAMHPARRSVAVECPCISHVTCRSAVVAGNQHAWYFTPDNANGAAILLLHGVGGTREDMLGIGGVFLGAGYPILVPDLRGFGQSEGTVTFGAQDRADVHNWVSWALAQPHVKRIYGFGVSLGGSIMLESLDVEERFRAVVAESAFSDFPSIGKERMRRQMPAGLTWLTTPFVDAGLLSARLREGVDLWAPSAVDAVRHSSTPVLLVHGLEDRATLPENSRRIAAANPATTQLWLLPKAAHANAWATAGKVFESRVLDWYAAH